MSITDELRKFIEDPLLGYASQDLHIKMLTKIADRIDAEHQKALDEWKAEHGQMWLKGYSECHAELLEGNETLASDLERCGWIRLPKDADGEYIHIGDKLIDEDDKPQKPAIVKCILYNDEGCVVSDIDPRGCWYDPSLLRHHHAPTVEDVLTEFGIDWEHESDCEDRAALLKEYAAKLQLKEDE